MSICNVVRAHEHYCYVALGCLALKYIDAWRHETWAKQVQLLAWIASETLSR